MSRFSWIFPDSGFIGSYSSLPRKIIINNSCRISGFAVIRNPFADIFIPGIVRHKLISNIGIENEHRQYLQSRIQCIAERRVIVQSQISSEPENIDLHNCIFRNWQFPVRDQSMVSDYRSRCFCSCPGDYRIRWRCQQTCSHKCRRLQILSGRRSRHIPGSSCPL